MKKFIIVYTAGDSALEETKKMTPEEMQQSMGLWKQWFDKQGDKLVDMGAPLGNGVSVFKGGNSKPQPHVVGSSVVMVNDIDEVKAMIADHPHLNSDDTGIDIFEVFPAPGM